jgi:hypothetical protein
MKYCDGTRTPTEIAAELSFSAGESVDEELIELALTELNKVGLLVEALPERQMTDTSRRGLIRTAVLALPVIATILVPTPAEAASMNPRNPGANTTCPSGSYANKCTC